MKRIAMLSMLPLLAGCAGIVKTKRITSPEANQEIDGVLFYEPTYVQLHYAFQALEKDGKVSGTAPDGCTPVAAKDEVQLMANLNKPYAIKQTRGFLTSNTFGVKLTNGLLTEVNVTSTSTLPDLIKAVTPIIKPGSEAVSGSGLQPCNASPTLVSLTQITLRDSTPRR